MMKHRKSLTWVAAMVAALFLVSGSAVASGAPVDNTQVTFDTFGHRLDAHDGDLFQTPDGTIYLYGTAYGCGFMLNRESPYCGVRVYTSTDLQTWTPAGAVGGYAFNHLTDDWQNECAPPGVFGCYRPHVIQRPSDGKYVMWINTHHDHGYRTLVADHPAGPFVETGIVPELAVKPPTGGLRYGDHHLYRHHGTAFLTYTVIYPQGNEHTLVIERLNSDLTHGTGEHTVIDAWPDKVDVIEAPALFVAPNGKWHVIYSDPARAYRVTGTSVMEAPHPTRGPWTNPQNFQRNSCSGQPQGVWRIKAPSGATRFVYGSDRWDEGNPNQSKANNYYGPMSFDSSGGVLPHRCVGSWSLG